MQSNNPGIAVSYRWTFNLLLLLFTIASTAYVVSTSSSEFFHVRYFSIVMLVGCVVVMMKTIFNILMYDNVKSVNRTRPTPLIDVAPVSCPDFWTRHLDEATLQPMCVNTYGDGTMIGFPIETKFDLSKNGSGQGNTDSSWTNTFCSQVKDDIKSYPRVVASKMCEYLGQM